MYRVTLSACGNIDHNENPFDSVVNKVRVNPEVVECSSIEECQEAVRRYIDDNLLGGGNWTGGKVYEGIEQIGYISYNGRYWEKGSEYFR